ncbi:MAG: hypothetical protein VXY93_14230, partial [Pseudomonadota bacterium]|nr:hypothetical protein [Pseudomonadota bacterium]
KRIMPLWGTSDSDESKPKNLTTAEKKEVYATNSGWVREAGSILSGNGNTDADPEVLVAVSGLADSIGAADVTEVEWITTTADKSEGFTLSVRVRYNEEVTVTGSPTLAVTNGNQGSGSGRGPHTLVYASGTGTNELVFSLAIAAANAATNANDVLSIGAQNIAKPSGATIKDTADGTTNAAVAISGAQGTAAGTLTVTA